MRRALPLLVCLSSLPVAAAPPPARYVLLPTNAAIYAAPSLSARSVHFAGAADDLARKVPVRWLRDVKDDFIEVESLQPSELSDHCYDLPLDAQIRWRFFVPRATLSPVLTRSVSVARSDGTGVALRAGVAVGERSTTASASQRRGVELQGLRAELPIPEDAIGVAYTVPSMSFDDHVTRRELAPRAPLTLDGASIRKGDGALLVYAERRAPGGVVVTLRHHCGEFRALTSRAAVRAAPKERNSEMETRPSEPPAIRIIAGASVYWAETNHLAGSIRDDIHLVGPVDITNGRLCFERRLLQCVTNPTANPPAPDVIRLCVDERNIAHRELR